MPTLNLSQVNKRLLTYFGIYVLGLALFSVLVFCAHRVAAGDDVKFPLEAQGMSLLEWLKHRYMFWSGRVGAETFIYWFSFLPLYVWRLTTIFFYGVLTFFLYKYYELFRTENSDSKNYLMLSLCMLLPYAMNVGALVGGSFWVTGSMNYLWIMAAAVVSFYPVAYYVTQRRLAHWSYNFFGAIATFIAASSQEQVGAVLVVFHLIFVGYHIYRHRKINLYIAFQTVLATFSLLVDYLSPGTSARLADTLAKHPRAFYDASINVKLERYYRWSLDATINHYGALLIIFWLLAVIILLKKQTRTTIDSFAIFLLTLASALFLVRQQMPSLFDFHINWRIVSHHGGTYVPIVFWSIVLLTTAIVAFRIVKDRAKSIITGLLVLAAYMSTAMVALSPTVYVSGSRTTFVPSILLVIAVLFLANYVINLYEKYSSLLMVLILGPAIYNYLFLSSLFLTKFQNHLPW